MALTYQIWKNDHQSILQNLTDKKIIMLFSGGKDSSIILSYLLKASSEFGFNFETHAGEYPHFVFTNEEKTKLDNYWKNRGVNIIWDQVSETDDLIDEALSNKSNPCHICYSVKKKYLQLLINNITIHSENIYVIFGFTLWDIVSYSIEYITGSFFADPNYSSLFQGKGAEERFDETSQRFYPLIQNNNAYTIFQPLIRYNEFEIKHAVEKENIPISTIGCQYREYRPKKILSVLYNNMNLKFDYDKVLAFSQNVLGLKNLDFLES